MKHVFTALIAVVAAISLAAPVTADWNRGDDHKMHFPQLPDPNGWDVKFGPFVDLDGNEQIKILADDWQCSQSGPVSDIHFWFSSKDDALRPDTAMIQNIHLSIWSNDPGVPGEVPSQPKEPLWWGDSEKGDFIVGPPQGPDTGWQSWYDPNLPFDQGSNPIPRDHQNYWQLNVTDIPNPFPQEKDEIYWLAVYMVTTPMEPGTSPLVELGWKTANTNDYPDPYTGEHFMDDAFYGHLIPDASGGPPPVDWIDPLKDFTEPLAPRSLDLAFVITPEPGTVAMLIGAGLIGLVAFARRRMKH